MKAVAGWLQSTQILAPLRESLCLVETGVYHQSIPVVSDALPLATSPLTKASGVELVAGREVAKRTNEGIAYSGSPIPASQF